MGILTFVAHQKERLLVVGIVKDLQLAPKSFSKAFLRVYKFVDGGSRLQFYQEVN
jgi:hypothetical protein